jgi:hypothetical protein
VPENEAPGIGLAEAIAQIRSELEAAEKEGRDSSIAFRTQQVELDFEVTFQDKRAVNGGLKVYVLSLGGKRERASGEVQRLKLRLTPIDPRTGEQKKISGVGKK